MMDGIDMSDRPGMGWILGIGLYRGMLVDFLRESNAFFKGAVKWFGDAGTRPTQITHYRQRHRCSIT
jgi:hypothetical protein